MLKQVNKICVGLNHKWRHHIFILPDQHLPRTSITRWLSPCTVVDLLSAINLISTTPSPSSTTATGPPRGRRRPTGSTKAEKVKVDGAGTTPSFPFQLDFDVVGFFFRSQRLLFRFSYVWLHRCLFFVLSVMVDFKKMFYLGIIRLVSPVCELLQLHLTFYY